MITDLGFETRPLTSAQAGAWAELWNAICVADGDNEFMSEQDLLEDFDNPTYDFEKGSIALYDGATMVGYGGVATRESADSEHEMRQFGGVHPAYRRRGIGAQVLAWCEQAAPVLHQARFPELPLALNGSCLVKNSTAMALFGKLGYTQARWFHEMRLDLHAAAPVATAPADVQVLDCTADRSADARLVTNESFRDHWGSTESSEETWAVYLGSNSFRPSLSFIGYLDAEPVSVVLSGEYEAYNEATGTREVYFNVVGTRRSGRGRGIASALLSTALATAKAQGYDTASLNVDADSPTGALGLYERLGFAVIDTSVTQRKLLWKP